MATTDDVSPVFPLPRILTYPADASTAAPVLVAQGAEARLYRTTFLTPDRPCALKYRPPKPYRHPLLDARLTRQRILAEARILYKCRRDGVPVPALYGVDLEDGGSAGGSVLAEWIDGAPVRVRINDWLAARPEAPAEALAGNAALLGLLRRIGAAVGALHRVGVVHGDLTTSNLMVRDASAHGNKVDSEKDGDSDSDSDSDSSLLGDIVIIDFGLASQSTTDEDRAVDLYVLERAFGSTHPRAEALFDTVLAAYGTAFRQSGPVLRKLDDVRMRGRKRSMLG